MKQGTKGTYACFGTRAGKVFFASFSMSWNKGRKGTYACFSTAERCMPLLVCHGTRDETENDAPRVLVCHEARDEEVRMRVLVCMLVCMLRVF